MIDVSNICVATDFSKNSEAAVPFAVGMAQKFGGKISLVHVFDGTYLFDAAAEAGDPNFTTPQHWIDPIYPKLKIKLNELAIAWSARDGVPFSPVLLTGHTIKEISKFVRDAKVNLLVISTHGRTGLSHAVFGSIAERLVQLSPCPVLTVRPEHPH